MNDRLALLADFRARLGPPVHEAREPWRFVPLGEYLESRDVPGACQRPEKASALGLQGAGSPAAGHVAGKAGAPGPGSVCPRCARFRCLCHNPR